MKKILTAALLSAAIAMPAMAADTPPMMMHGKKSADGKPDKCDAKHDMGGMMGGGMMGGGMMGGGMMGGGMMGGGMMGGGMMGGGMMGGGMMGGGMMGGMMLGPDTHMLETLSLSKEQRASINKISDEVRHNNWATLGLLNDETAKLRDLYQADKRDPAAIDAEYQKVFDLKRQMIKAHLEAENRIEDILTADQRTKLKEARSQMRRMYNRN